MKKYQNEILEFLKGVISFDTTLDLSTKGDLQPFGLNTRKCIEYVLDHAKNLGFRVKNNDGYYGYAEYGSGEELILVLAHLDVVPVGDLSLWDSDPFELRITDEYLFARGVADDKGDACLALYALKSLVDEGQVFNKRVRILFGLNEETGFECVKKYVESEELPTYGFTPDANFPVCHGEKGIMQLSFKAPFKSEMIKKINAGMAANSVAASASAHLSDLTQVKKVFSDLKVDDQMLVLETTGVSAHAMEPHVGKNAMDLLVEELLKLEQIPALLDYQKYLKSINGASLGIDLADEFGNLTFNVGMANLKDEVLEVIVDIRYPITKKAEEIYQILDESIKQTCYQYHVLNNKAGVYFELDSKLVRACVESYQEVTNDYDTLPYTMGGGTYARSMPNLVAIGGAMPNEKEYIHAPNERRKIENFFKGGEIIKVLIKKLLSE